MATDNMHALEIITVYMGQKPDCFQQFVSPVYVDTENVPNVKPFTFLFFWNRTGVLHVDIFKYSLRNLSETTLC